MNSEKLLLKDVAKIFIPVWAENGRDCIEIRSIPGDVLISNGVFEKFGGTINERNCKEIDCSGKWLIPGIIDDQTHLRDGGILRNKSNYYQETRAAIIGGTTSVMDMHNIIPPTISLELLNEKYEYASRVSLANFSFYMGCANDNYDEVMKVVEKHADDVCGLKLFLGSSTGNLLIDNMKVVEDIMRNSGEMLIAAHCEDDKMIKKNQEALIQQKGDWIHAEQHPIIRNAEACYASSSKAIKLAKKTGARFHVFHITTAMEVDLFDGITPLSKKKITSEVCVHHLYFNDKDYETYGNLIVCNPAIKSEEDRKGLISGLLTRKLDVIATDHAAHTYWEKRLPYFDFENKKQKTPSGVPTIQHSFNMMKEVCERDGIPLELAIKKMTVDVATCYKINKRGAIQMGCAADCFLFDPEKRFKVRNYDINNPESNVMTTAGWSPFDGKEFIGQNIMTIVNGNIVYRDGIIHEVAPGQRLMFNRG